MGFCIDSFFGELQEIRDNKDLDEQEMLAELEEAIDRGQQYAIDCGVIEPVK